MPVYQYTKDAKLVTTYADWLDPQYFDSIYFVGGNYFLITWYTDLVQPTNFYLGLIQLRGASIHIIKQIYMAFCGALKIAYDGKDIYVTWQHPLLGTKYFNKLDWNGNLIRSGTTPDNPSSLCFDDRLFYYTYYDGANRYMKTMDRNGNVIRKITLLSTYKSSLTFDGRCFWGHWQTGLFTYNLGMFDRNGNIMNGLPAMNLIADITTDGRNMFGCV